MRFARGARVGTFEIVAPLGTGGMGEVYRARDTKLNREVALKVLPEDFALDSDRLARFRREAQLVASLNHPNIAAIHGLEESGGLSALVLELVEGPTLANRIAQGPIPIDEALAIARQVAEALEAAHERGVVHRDLKPANIKIRPDGTVKVLDFGLAKALEGDMASPDVSQSPTLTVAGTRVGVILGTAAYMAPEQARGKAVDKRADVWAFGCVVYEMLTGRGAFPGDEVSDILASVLAREPDFASLPADTPESLRRLIRRCLQKDRKERLHDIADARLELRDAAIPEPLAPHTVFRVDRLRQRLRFVASLAAGSLLVGVAVAVGITTYVRPSAVESAALRFLVAPPDGSRWPPLSPNTILSISPDGHRIAFVARSAENTDRIWIRSLDTLAMQELAGTDGANSPFWSPDSQSVAFFADGKLKKITLAGGPAVRLCDAPTARGGAWSPEGVIIFGNVSGPLQRVSAAGGTPASASVLAKNETSHVRPSFLPDGRHFLFGAGPAQPGVPIHVGSLDSTDRTRLMDADATNVSYSQGHLLFLREMTLWAQPFDTMELTLTGEAFPVAETIATAGILPTAMFSPSTNGVLTFQTGASLRSKLVWLDRTGRQTATLGDEANYIDLEMSPDSKQVAVSILDPTRRTSDIWIYDVMRGVRTRFTSEPGDDTEPVWSPDGGRILFISRRKGFFDAYVRSASDGNETAFIEDPSNKYATGWSHDGRFMVYARNGVPAVETGTDLWFLPLDGDRKPVAFIQTRFNEGWPRLSADGRWLAYRSDESGRTEIYVVSFPKPGRKWVLSNGGGELPRWRRDGKEVFFVAPDNMLMAATVDGRGSTFEVGAVKPLFEVPPKPQAITGVTGWRYDVSADGQRFLVDVPVEQSTTRPLTVVVNWTAGVKK